MSFRVTAQTITGMKPQLKILKPSPGSRNTSVLSLGIFPVQATRRMEGELNRTRRLYRRRAQIVGSETMAVASIGSIPGTVLCNVPCRCMYLPSCYRSAVNAANFLQYEGRDNACSGCVISILDTFALADPLPPCGFTNANGPIHSTSGNVLLYSPNSARYPWPFCEF